MRERLVPHVVAATVTTVVLAPLALPGYVLRYDMVFVPRPALSWEVIAPATALPRAVPQDAVVALVSQLLPGWLLQRLVLVAILYLAALGAARLVPTQRVGVRVVAALGYAWTPYLAERLLIGQWGLLVAYAALPWLVRAAIGVRDGERGALRRLLLAAAASAITPTGGLLALVVVTVLLVGRYSGAARTALTGIGTTLLLNAPWLVAGFVSTGSGRSDPVGVAVFAARAENWAGPLVALAGTGGIWNGQATPASRGGWLIPVATLLVLAVAGYGVPVLWRRWSAPVVGRLGLLAVASWLGAALGVLPGGASLLGWLVTAVPGAGLLRDGQKLLMPYVLLLVVAGALGAERLAGRLATRFDQATGRVLLAGAALLPLAVLPDLAVGGAGRLRPVAWPADWETVARLVDERPGEVVSLPFQEYQSYAWNGGRVVIDPAPRYLGVPVLIDDTLRVDGTAVAGEDPRAARLRELLVAGEPVAAAGPRWVLVQRAAGPTPDPATLAGLRPVYAGAELTLYENPAWRPAARPSRPGPVGLAHLLAGTVVLVLVFSGTARLCYRVVASRHASPAEGEGG
ncbi:MULTISPECIES: hypothetical protein [unclassified Micromonospora]|uniref:hypothetical protein n=1 Tax=unclassified Micromonospora TaxID=2617518 RepID=UPI0022B712F2|nr:MULTISPECIES: hypothetical protein [unclassified Micromonospora]MCZ7417973.1 hypothetical protein [Verrucosispora sp. WMMA2121]MCZ7419560.1 hypothetical protein [Verrucosispora sp. WMMA2121]MCZ7419579.1 hypothetical protein [Verrucosispora sp. WMMA2121]WBB93189.1 hypothetical protein O7597_09555 [Verrucosispora sp. WMMC514]